MQIKINSREIDWKKYPPGWYLTDVEYNVLWKNEETGAMLILIKVPAGGVHELPHSHPDANQLAFILSGEIITEKGETITYGEGNYGFSARLKGQAHGPRIGSTQKVTKESYMLQYFDGPPSKLNTGETKKLAIDYNR